ncbi:undecaprenyl-phosphate glucose phosphotransferase [Rhizobium halophytocola]|uniref:Undecaprenyl-phosphate glucose phosphotransferase n=1 Tax=Rhizobium halophytocola TaxID=735519 RepID=A0ABS4DYA5_9HYPH|nr:undecaprenyl-phosphate glucose phosphotransferase [Rhizobium halophytocola]MBP1850667.1 Undecaprenyl-phosphate glucose phosphotransferase [Rhizobium halophytocola]
MSQVRKSEPFDAEALRKRMTENAPPETASTRDGANVEINAKARRVASQFSAASHTPTIVTGQVRLLEFGLLLATGLVMHFALTDAPAAAILLYAALSLVGAAVAIITIRIADCYHVGALRSRMHYLPRVLGAWTVTCALIGLSLFLAQLMSAELRLWFLAWYATGAVVLVLERISIAFAIRRWARNGVMERRAVIVGGGQPAKDLIRAIEQQQDNDIRICGIFDDRGPERSPVMIAGYPKLGTIAELVEFARVAHIDMLIIALPLNAEDRILGMLRKLWVLPVDIRLAAHSNSLRFRPRSYSHVGAVPMLDILDKPIRDWDSVAKRIFDVVFSLGALAVLWPVLLVAALAVKLTSKGPIIFVQKRHGFNNEIINVLKFRSMYTNMSDPTATRAVSKGDPRVTPVGRFIRKSSIDELPQLFNVLRGDLSLVGPRPHAVAAQTHDRRYADVVEGYFARHRVKPGVTGWAQINGWRGEMDNDDKIRFRTAYDLYYIENWSLLFDLKILFLTPFKLLNTENAY